jgi:AraC family transcriptional regulator
MSRRAGKELLQKGEMTISEVATLVGFYDQSHLNRHFKRIVGVSPKVIQQNSKNVLWISSSVQDAQLKPSYSCSR